MSIAPGTRFGAYDVRALIGAGGMGEVYRARDSRLGRDVALKVLPEAFVADTERLARFKREAHLLASLNPPNIAAIYGLEEADGTPALVLELVEGPTLAEQLARGPLPLEDALTIARQIASTLDAAHEHGVVHRDLKPANIKVRPDGTTRFSSSSKCWTRMRVVGAAACSEPPPVAGGRPARPRTTLMLSRPGQPADMLPIVSAPRPFEII